MKRFDVFNGFLITVDGRPYQAMYRYWLVSGRAKSVYWVESDGPMSPAMANFVYSSFAEQLLIEFLKAH